MEQNCIKKGASNGHQRYKCAPCGKIFQGGIRLNPDQIWKEYTEGKQTYTQLALKYGCSNKTIQRMLDLARTHKENTFPSVANLLMDMTFFGRSIGVMVFKDSITGCILYKYYVNQETNQLYLNGVEEISGRGIKIQSIIYA